ncbi:THRRS [Symbiodinium sp. CCMP2592]|nr:THRRS [Symbiodinium sp. CCMP2592]
MSISKGLAESAVVAKVIYKESVESLKQCVVADVEEDEPEEQADAEQSVLWDMTRPLEGSCRMELLKFDHPQGQDVFWHSSAHILGGHLGSHKVHASLHSQVFVVVSDASAYCLLHPTVVRRCTALCPTRGVTGSYQSF